LGARSVSAVLLWLWVMSDVEPSERKDAGTDGGDTCDVVFYDGHCGLCHRWVKFVIPRVRTGRFRFAPLQGLTVAERLDEATRATLPDSIVLLEADGTLRVKSDAALTILRGLGSGWRGLAALGRMVPRFLRDWVYDGIATIRYRVFARPSEACPLMPPDLRGRFLA